MQIVIDIPEVFYEYCKAQKDAAEIQLAIKNGTPLPKGHGRLIDADALKADIQKHADIYANYGHHDLVSMAQRDGLLCAVGEVVNAPTIIEAEGEDDSN